MAMTHDTISDETTLYLLSFRNFIINLSPRSGWIEKHIGIPGDNWFTGGSVVPKG